LSAMDSTSLTLSIVDFKAIVCLLFLGSLNWT